MVLTEEELPLTIGGNKSSVPFATADFFLPPDCDAVGTLN